MGLSIVFTLGLVLWLVLWSLGQKSIDAFMITIVIALVAILVKTVTPYMPGNRQD